MNENMNARLVLLLVLAVSALSSQPVMAVEQAGGPDRPSKAQPSNLDVQLQSIYDHAAKAIADKDIHKADFWLTRYLGLTVFNEHTQRRYADLDPLIQQRKDLAPTAFISGQYSASFLDFFIRGAQQLWDVPEEGVSADDATCIIRTYSNEKYFVEVVASPVLEAWTIMREDYPTAIIPLVAATPPAFLASGTLSGGELVRHFPNVVLNAQGSYLQYVWPIEAHDLDGDGISEIWVRYNQAWADGFAQILEIYKIEHEAALVLFKRFEGTTEGIARRLEDGTIEVAEGVADQAADHLGFDRHHIETLAFQQGEFVKVAERNVPHLLWGDAWKAYYFSGLGAGQ